MPNSRTLGVALLCLLFSGLVQAETWTVQEPGFPTAGQSGERVLVRVSGPAKKKPYLKLGASTEVVTLEETGKGQYVGEVRLPVSGQRSLVLSEPTTRFRQNLGLMKVLLKDRSWTARSETVTRQGPHPDYDRLTPLYKGQKVVVDGFRGGWFRCRGSGTWVDARQWGKPSLATNSLAPNRLNRVLLNDAPNGDALLTFQMDRPTEVQVEHDPVSGILKATLHDSYQTTFDIKRPTGVAKFLGPVILRPQTKPRAVSVEMSSTVCTGYQLRTDSQGSVILRLRKPITHSLKDLKITIDPGHGGPKDKGTVGHGGLAEKTLNLRVAKAIAKLLRERGAEVLMTRTTDSDVASLGGSDGSELQARIDRSVEAGSQLFLSVHHNARPNVERGKVYHGTDIYWYQPQSQTLAKSLADPIADAIGEPTRSFRWRSFYVIRQTHSPAVLMEFQYLSNPVLEKSVLSQPDYPEKAARGVVKGLEKYLSN